MKISLPFSAALLGLALAAAAQAGGCAGKGRSIDCPRMCEKLAGCEDLELDVEECQDLCHDGSAERATQRSTLDRCTDCLDEAYSCSDAAEKCPICADVDDAVSSASAL